MKKSTAIKLLISIPLIAVAVIIGFRVITQALIDDSNSVHIDATKIEDSTIIIGTHLIYLGSMNDTIYEAAQKSAEESSQYNMYYKSELSSGLWFDITDASSLEDITTSGVPVDNSVINNLNMTHHTKSDGITYDLRTGESIAICDIKSPYDLAGLDELNPLKIQYDNISANDDRSETDDRNLALIKDFYSLDFSDSITDEYDESLKALQEYYEILQRDDGEQYMSDIVNDVMTKIDAARRMQTFENIQIEAIDNLIKAVSRNKKYDSKDILGSKTNNEETEEEEENDESESEESEDGEEEGSDKIDGFSVDNNLLSALSEAVGNIEESYNTYSNKMLDEGITVLSRTEYNEILLLVAAAKSKDYATCDIQVNRISYMNQISNGTIKNRDKEREYLETVLIPSSEETYLASVGSGAGKDYKALPSTAASATKQSVLKKQKAETDRIRTELQFLIKAKIDRLDSDKAETYIKTLINNSSYYTNAVKNDAFAEYARSSVESYVLWLNEQLAAVKGTMGDGTIDGLMSKKSQLQQQKLEALDNNDLAKAKRIDAEIEAIDKTIADEETRLNNIINSPTATEAEKAAAAASLGSSTASGAINNLEKDILSSLKDGDLDGIESQINSIGDLASVSPQSALNSLKNIYDELTAQKLMGTADSTAIDNLLGVTETVTSDNIGIYTDDLSENDLSKIIASYLGVDGSGSDGSGGNGNDGSGGSGNDGSGGSGGNGNDGSGGNGSDGSDGSGGSGTDGSDELSMSDLFGANSKLLTDKEQATALAALGMYYDETKSETAGNILDRYANALMNSGNPYIFNKYTQDGLNNYVPADKVALLSGYRYIFNDSQKKVILQKGSDYYIFNAFSNVVERPMSKTEEMELSCGYQNTIYICESFVSKFGIEIQTLGNGAQAIVLSDKDNEKASELFDYFVEVGGR